MPPLSGRYLLIFGLLLVCIALIPFWGSIAVAAVFAFGLYPAVARLAHRANGKKQRRWPVFFCVLALALLCLLPASLFSVRLYNLATAPKQGDAKGMLSTETLNKMASAKEKVEGVFIKYGVSSKVFRTPSEGLDALQSASEKIFSGAVNGVSAALITLPEIFLAFLVFCLFLYLFLSRATQIKASVVQRGVVEEADLNRFNKVMQSSCYNSLVSNLLIGVIQSSIVAAGARLSGYRETVMIFTLVFVLSFIPFIGAAPVAYGLALLSLLNDNIGSAIALAVVGTIAGTVDNVIRPYLVASGENEVHPIISFAVILGAIAIFGLKGLFLGPVMLTATVGMLQKPTGN